MKEDEIKQIMSAKVNEKDEIKPTTNYEWVYGGGENVCCGNYCKECWNKMPEPKGEHTRGLRKKMGSKLWRM